MSIGQIHEFAGADSQGASKAPNGSHGRVPRAALDVGDEGSVEIGFKAELLLGEPTSFADLAYGAAEGVCGIWFFPSFRWHSQLRIEAM